jgi:hypothetical protein
MCHADMVPFRPHSRAAAGHQFRERWTRWCRTDVANFNGFLTLRAPLTHDVHRQKNLQLSYIVENENDQVYSSFSSLKNRD